MEVSEMEIELDLGFKAKHFHINHYIKACK
jgi:hypothetical protein